MSRRSFWVCVSSVGALVSRESSEGPCWRRIRVVASLALCLAACATGQVNREEASLLRAAMHDDLNAVVRELRRGADVQARDDRGWTALSYAAFYGRNCRIIRELVSRGADPNARDIWGRTPLMLGAVATMVDSPDSVRCLLASGARPNEQDALGRTALHHAVAAKHPASWEVIEALLDGGSDPRTRDREGRTPESAALAAERPELARRLRLHGERKSGRKK